MGGWVDLDMSRYISLLLLIGYAWGHLKVKSEHTLQPFNIVTKSYVSTLVGKNGQIQKNKKDEELIVTVNGVWDCTDDYDCILEISWKEKKDDKSKITNSTYQKISDLMETVDNMNKNLRVINIKDLVNVVNTVDNYSFIESDTEIEFELEFQGKILKEKTGIMKLITDNGETLSILNPSYFVKMIEEWEKQKPKRKGKKRIYIPLH